MRHPADKPARRRFAQLAAAPLVLALTIALGACGGDDDPLPPTSTPTTPGQGTPAPTQTSRNVSRCLSQTILPATSTSEAVTLPGLILPDTLKLDFTRQNGFPNGRQFDDPVIDLELAALLLDLRLPSQPVTRLIGVLNVTPPSDNATTNVFPFLKAANGGQPTPGTATTFDFRLDPESSYVRVDRMGNPAIATALIGTTTGAAGLAMKNSFNDSDPADDVTGAFVDEAVRQLTTLHNVLADDLAAASLIPCSTPG